MIKVLVLVQDYPDNNDKIKMMYVHTRNKYYILNNINVTVLNFRAKESYTYDGIQVITLKDYKKEKKNIYDILIIHAANIKNHFRFLNKYGCRFPRFVFFFHGHEVLKINKTYSKAYSFVKKSKLKILIQNIYDNFKLLVWRYYYPKVVNKSEFVFVSRWMLEMFLKWTKIPFSIIKNNYLITYNGIGKLFEKTDFDRKGIKEYDFITIRGDLDGSKYCVDIVNELAKNNPKMKFLLVGKGKFFEYFKKADNIVWKNQTMNHQEIIENLQKSRCALMPTRTDAQGLMMCEMASIGIPLITSDIPVCHEIFSDFKNVYLINNDDNRDDLEKICKLIEERLPIRKNEKYFSVNTIRQEVILIKKCIIGKS